MNQKKGKTRSFVIWEKAVFVFMLITIMFPYFTPFIAVVEALTVPTLEMKALSVQEDDQGLFADLQVSVDNTEEKSSEFLLEVAPTEVTLDSKNSTLPKGITGTAQQKKVKLLAEAKVKGTAKIRLRFNDQTFKTGAFTVNYQGQKQTATLPQKAPANPEVKTEVTEESEVADEADPEVESQAATTKNSQATTATTNEKSAGTPKKAVGTLKNGLSRAGGRDITTLPGADKLKNSPDGPTIINKGEIFKGGQPLKTGDTVDVGDELSLNYDWSIPEALRPNIKAGDTFTFKLPDQFKVQNAPVTGDFIDGGVNYGSFVIDKDGKITITFSGNVANKANVKGSMSATVYIDKEHIPDKGGNEIKIPYTDGTHDVTPDIVVPKDQSIDKEVVEDGSTKSQDITDNKAVVQWRVWANKLGFPMSNAKITETLPKGVTYKDGLKVIKHQLTPDKEGTTGKTEDVTSQIALTPDAKDSSKFVLSGFPEVKANDPYKYEIVFNSEVDFDKATVSKIWGQDLTANLTNTATLNSDQDKNIQTKATKTYTSDISYDKKIDKTGTQPGFDETGYKAITPSPENGNSNGVIAWGVPFKKVGLDAPAKTTIQDVMNGGQKFADANGKILNDTEIGALLTKQLQASGGRNANKTVTVVSKVSEDGQTTTYDITFPDGFSESFDFTYYTNVMAKSGQTLNNSMKWSDNGKNDNYKVPEFSKGVKGYDKTPDGKPNIDANNEISWTINVNTNKGEITNWFVEDTIKQGGAYSPGTFTVTEYYTILTGREYSKELKENTDYTLTQNGDSFKIETMYKGQKTKSRFVVTYKTKVDPNSPDAVSNSFIYHYTHDHTDWETGGTQEFTPNPEEQRTLNANKSGEYFFDSTTGEDKIRWKVQVNVDKIPWGANAHFYDVLEADQVWDDTSEVKVYDESGNDLNVEKKGLAFKTGNKVNTGMYWNVVRAGKSFYYGPKLNVNGKSTDTIVVNKFPEGESTTYTIEFVTKLKNKVTDKAQETVSNKATVQDDKNKKIEPPAEVTFTRNNQSIDKVHQQLQHDDKTGIDFVPYEVTINRLKEKLTNVVVEDSGWENIIPNEKTVVVKDSAGKVIDPSKYTVEKTQQQLFISFNEEINDTYTIHYDAEVQYKKGTENTTITLKNNVNVTGDGFSKTPGPTPDGYDTKVPSVITSVTGDTPITKLIVHKVDPGDASGTPKPIKGVLFTLVQAEVDKNNNVIYENGKAKIKQTILKNIATNDKGIAEFDKLEQGAYFLVETKTVGNYLINNEYKSHKNDSGQIDPGYLIKITDTRKTPTITIDVENESIPIKGKKTWADDNNSLKKRPTEITVKLMKTDNAGKIVEVDRQKVTGPDWAYTFDNQPAHDDQGNSINYSIEEEAVPGYESLYNGTNIVNSILVDITANKEWDDNNDRDGNRTAAVDFTLQKAVKDNQGAVTYVDVLDNAGKPIRNEKVTAADGWQTTFKNLPKYDRFGELIEYHINEKPVKGYNTSVEVGKDGKLLVKNYNPPATVNMNGSKTWVDNNNADKTRPNSIFIQLMKLVAGTSSTVPATDLDNKAIPVKEVKASDQWAWAFNKLPKYENGKAIVYSVREVQKSGNTWVPVANKDYTSTAKGMNVTNTQNAELKGTKQWFDNNNAAGFRPEKLNVILQQSTDGKNWQDVPGKSTTTQGPAWSYRFEGLPKYQADGKTEIQYKVREEAVTGAKGDLSKYTQDNPETPSMDLGNTFTSQKISINGVKTWDDSDDVAGARPKEITLRLKKKNAEGKWVQATDTDGKEMIQKIAVGTADITYSFVNLPKYEKGVEIQYRIEEDEVEGYSAEVKPDNSEIINANPPVETTVSGEKTWKDGDDQDGLRPTSIKLQLMRHIDGEAPTEAVNIDNKKIAPITVTADKDGKWVYNFDNLPKFYKGQEIIYTVKELNLNQSDYRVSQTNPDENPMDITNTHKPEETTLKGKKTWDDADDQDGKRPEKITVILQQKDEKGVWVDVAGKQQEVTAATQWQYEFTGLAKNRKGEAIEYRVREDISNLPEGYKSKYTDTKQADVTNSYTPETIIFKGKKNWEDNGNTAGFRPKTSEVTFTLHQGKVVNGKTIWQAGETIKPVDNGVTNQWEFAFTKPVPKYYDHGKVYQYKVTEDMKVNSDKYSYKVTFAQDKKEDASNPSVNTRETTITNNNPPIVIPVKATKVWKDDENLAGKRPTEVEFTLYKVVDGSEVLVDKDQDGEAIVPLKATEANGWKVAFENLPKYEHGSAVNYIVKETAIGAGYTSKVENVTPAGAGEKAPTQLKVTNTKQPETTEFTGTKVWEDDNNRDGKRPDKVTIHLQEEKGAGNWVDVPDQVLELNEENNWQATFTDLPKYREGKVGELIKYRVSEQNGGRRDKDEGAAVAEYEAGYVDVAATEDKVGSTTVTNTHTPEKFKVTGTKLWNDQDNTNGVRPTSITIRLMKLVEGKLVQAKYIDGKDAVLTINKSAEEMQANEWTFEFDNLYKFENGKPIQYLINEDPIEDSAGVELYSYEMAIDSAGKATIKNTNPPEMTKVNGTKTWQDNNNQDGVRPTAIKVQLMRQVVGGKLEVAKDMNGKEIAAKTVKPDAKGNWTYEFTDLPKNAKGAAITYSVKEVALDTKLGYTSTTNGMNLTNARTPETYEVTGKKTWQDGNNQDGIRPVKIKVTLQEQLADGTWQDVAGQAQEAAAPSYEYHFERVAKFRDQGQKINYRVKEEAIEGVAGDFKAYKRVDEQKDTNLTNAYTPQTTEFEGVKVWSDHDNQNGKRPDSITVHLKKVAKDGSFQPVTDLNGQEVQPQVVKAANQWKYIFKDLAKYEEGQEIQYAIVEDEVPDYSAEVSADNKTLTNTNPPVTTEVKGEKTWADNDDQDGLRPTAIKVQLMRQVFGQAEPEVAVYQPAEGKTKGEPVPVKTVEVGTDGKWTYTFTDLPKFANGKEISYFVKELDVPKEYQATVDKDQPMNLLNTHKPASTKVTGKKTWDDNNNAAGKRPETIKVQLMRQVKGQEMTVAKDQSGVEIPVKTVAPDQKGDWTYEFTNLPKFADGEEITYSVKEVEVPAEYQAKVSKDNPMDLINSYQPEVTKIPVKKVWVDNNDANKRRPNSIMVALMQNGKQIATKKITAKEQWQTDFTNLEVKDAKGENYVYTVKEVVVPTGYTAIVKGTTITNTYKPGTPPRKYPKTGEIVSKSAPWIGLAVVAGAGGIFFWRKRKNKEE